MMINVADNPIRVLILATSSDDAQLKQNEAENILATSGVHVTYSWIPEVNGARLALLARLERYAVVVLPIQGYAFPEEEVIRMLAESDCAVLLVR